MARIPTQQRDVVSPRGAPAIRDTRQSTVDVLGERTQQAVEGSVSQFQKLQLKAAEEAKQLAVAKARNAFDENTMAHKSKLAEAEGENTLAVAAVEQENLRRANEQVLENTPDRWRNEFSAYADRSMLEYQQFRTAHENRANQEVWNETVKARASILKDRAILAAPNDQAFVEEIAELMSVIKFDAVKQFGGLDGEISPEVEAIIKDRRSRVLSSTVRDTLEQFASQPNLQHLRLYHEKYGKYLRPDDAQAVNQMLTRAGDQEKANTAKSLADLALTHYPDNELMAAEFVRQNTADGDVLRQATSMLTVNYSIRARQEREDRADRFSRAYDLISKDPNNAALIPTLVDNPEDRQKLLQVAVQLGQGKFTISKPETINRLYAMAHDEPDRFIQEPITRYRADLNESDYRVLESMWRRAREKNVSDRARQAHRSDKEVGDIISSVTKSRGVNPKIRPEQASHIQQIGRQLWQDMLEADPEGKTPPIQMRKEFHFELLRRIPPQRDERGLFRRWFGIGEAPTPIPAPVETPRTSTARLPHPSIVEGIKAQYRLPPPRGLGREPTAGELAASLEKAAQEIDITRPDGGRKK